MFSRTSWRIGTWNDIDVQVAVGFGLGGGRCSMGLLDGACGDRYDISGPGVSASIGVGLDIMGVSFPTDGILPGPDARTAGGTLYKNDLLVPGSLSIADLRDFVLVRGFEIDTGLDVGAKYYCCMFHSNLAAAGSTVGAAALGIFGEAAFWAACRAVTFFAVRSRSLPSAALAGHRYQITSVIRTSSTGLVNRLAS